ncbi:MAG: stage II sporulation protein E, partial [Gammaproteobacteria bacterium]|nr:stage II sporulation protein E [Gammaproteobacteria bacterium]
AISSVIVLDDLLKTLLKNVIENAGAEKGILLLKKQGQLFIEAQGDSNSDDTIVLQSISIDSSRHTLPVSLM